MPIGEHGFSHWGRRALTWGAMELGSLNCKKQGGGEKEREHKQIVPPQSNFSNQLIKCSEYRQEKKEPSSYSFIYSQQRS